MFRRVVSYDLPGAESEPDSEENFEISAPSTPPPSPHEAEYQVVDEWDPSMDENPADIAEEETEPSVPS